MDSIELVDPPMTITDAGARGQSVRSDGVLYGLRQLNGHPRVAATKGTETTDVIGVFVTNDHQVGRFPAQQGEQLRLESPGGWACINHDMVTFSLNESEVAMAHRELPITGSLGEGRG